MTSCLVCRTESVSVLLDLGPQPICNRFPAVAQEKEFTHPLIVGQCDTCGLVQLISPVPAREISPRVEWITYSEPEAHLDRMADMIGRLPGLTSDSVIGGVSFKDDTTLRRMNARGFARTWRLDPSADLGIGDRRIGVETIQDRLTSKAAEGIVRTHGKSDALIARHILEHAHAPGEFLAALKHMVSPHGYIVLEVPDCTQALIKHDYTTLWEEHTFYFTEATFRYCLAASGLGMVQYDCYPYAFENSLVAIARPNNAAASDPPKADSVAEERRRAGAFAADLPRYRERYRKCLVEQGNQHGKIALFGAGHLACTFVNVLGLKEAVAFVVDDNPNKQGLLMAGSKLPIRGSAALIEEDIGLCLLSLNPESEDKVIQKNQRFVERGGVFASIFPASKRALNT